ncbi:hypothetical protein ABD91_03325 [Lysinibacillus sphaericus]|uniref:hypothetical protein n=1 Tax=Lysinibacillus sphaericus TaxID=1421 RepID=UPI0018CCFD7D|nr:hypothetical protein [Lysinibacillus sphaericus]MBG9689950.1 hypothetical protein [Lysinibacillus sphaericus]
MFLKQKKASGKLYFALCESVRKDGKVVTKTIKSLGSVSKAEKILKDNADYNVYLGKFYEIVGTKKCRDKNVGTKKYRLIDEDGDFLLQYYSGLGYGRPMIFWSMDAAERERIAWEKQNCIYSVVSF